MSCKNLSILGAILLGTGVQTAAVAAQTPNHYACIGRNVSLALTVGSKAEVGILPGQTALDLQLGRRSYSFHDTEVVAEPTLIGDLWEVTLEQVPDLYVKHASVLIPSVSLGQSPAVFRSQLILTTVNTPFIATPFEGVVNPSKYIDLACTASMLYF